MFRSFALSGSLRNLRTMSTPRRAGTSPAAPTRPAPHASSATPGSSVGRTITKGIAFGSVAAVAVAGVYLSQSLPGHAASPGTSTSGTTSGVGRHGCSRRPGAARPAGLRRLVRCGLGGSAAASQAPASPHPPRRRRPPTSRHRSRAARVERPGTRRRPGGPPRRPPHDPLVHPHRAGGDRPDRRGRPPRGSSTTSSTGSRRWPADSVTTPRSAGSTAPRPTASPSPSPPTWSRPWPIALRAAERDRRRRRPDGRVPPSAASATTATSPRCAGGVDGTLPAPAPVPGWRSVVLDAAAGTVTLPAGTLLDLGATAKAWAADRAAAAIAARLGCGVLVSLGGDVSVHGRTRRRVRRRRRRRVRRPRRPDRRLGAVRWPRHLRRRQPPLDPRRHRGPPPRRPGHRPAGRPVLAHGDGGRRLVRRRQHRLDRVDGPRRAAPRPGWPPGTSRPGWSAPTAPS